MKKFLVFLLVLCMPFSVMAESNTVDKQEGSEVTQFDTLTVENCEELTVIFRLMNERDERIKEFAKEYAGRMIEFDGNIVYFVPHEDNDTRYDISMYAVEYSESPIYGPRFHFVDVGSSDFGFRGSTFPKYMHAGSEVHVVGIIEQYDESSNLFILDPVSISPSGEVTSDKLDTSAYTDELDTSAYVSLEKGNKGDGVKTLQQRLIDLYYLNDKADGIFGKNTQAAVEKFQAKNELEVTGIADPMTQAVLFSEKAVENTLSISSGSIVIGSMATTTWYVDGQEFTLKNTQTKTVKTVWGTYKFDAFGNYEKID